MINLSFKRLGRMLAAAVELGLKLVGGVIELFASSAQTIPADEELNNSLRGGVINHRTGKFDDGSDPAGWYERD